MITIPFNFNPRPYQLEVFRALDGEEGKPETKKKRVILRWHRRAGKDKTCFCYMIKEAARVPGNYFYVFPTKEEARKALWINMDADGFKLLHHIPKQLIKAMNNQEMSITLTNDSTINVIGLDKNPDGIRGVAAKGFVFSEFAFSDPDGYKIVMPSIRESDGWVIFNSTPNGRNHFYEMWQAVFNSPRWFASLLQTYYPDRPGYSGLIPTELLPEIMLEEGLSEEDMEREYGVDFSTGMKGAFYSDQIDAAYATGRVGNFMCDGDKPVNTYWDLGVDDTDAVWFGQQQGNTTVFLQYWEKNGQGTDDLAKMLANTNYTFGTHYLPHDAAHRIKGKQVVTTESELRQSLRDYHVSGRIHTLSRNPSKQSGILAVRKLMPLCRFDLEGCREGLEHLSMYHRKYDKRRQVFLQEPVHDQHSHCADAFRMKAESQDNRNDYFYKINKIKVLKDFDPLM